MSTNSGNVRVAVTGAIYLAPVGTAAPASATATLPAAWVDLGFVSDKGVKKATKRGTNDIKAWQNAAKVRTTVTDSGVSFQFVLLETTVAGVGAYTGSTVDPATGKVSVNPGRTGGRRAMIIDVIDGAFVRRIYVPQAEIVDAPGDQMYTSGDAIAYDLTIQGYAATELTGDTYVEFIPQLITVAPVVATISSALPASQGVGAYVKLIGTGFATAVSITVGGVPAPGFDVESDTVIYVPLPAGTAGSAPIIVTNLAGASTAQAYTRV